MGISLTDTKPQNFPVKTLQLPHGHFQVPESEPVIPRLPYQLAAALGGQTGSVYGFHSPRILTRHEVIEKIKTPQVGDAAKVKRSLGSCLGLVE